MVVLGSVEGGRVTKRGVPRAVTRQVYGHGADHVGGGMHHSHFDDDTRKKIAAIIARTGHGVRQADFADFLKHHPNMLFPAFSIQATVCALFMCMSADETHGDVVYVFCGVVCVCCLLCVVGRVLYAECRVLPVVCCLFAVCLLFVCCLLCAVVAYGWLLRTCCMTV